MGEWWMLCSVWVQRIGLGGMCDDTVAVRFNSPAALQSMLLEMASGTQVNAALPLRETE